MWRWCGLFLLLIAVGCVPEPVVVDGGVVLVSDVTLQARTPTVTRVISATATFTLAVGTEAPLLIPTSIAAIALATPTLPPSKTPTLTATHSLTPLPTDTSTATSLANPTLPPLPPDSPGLPSGVVPIPTALPASNSAIGCSPSWFFTALQPTVCPLNPPLESDASLQLFQQGLMIWVGRQDAIYVLYNGSGEPGWQVYNDTWVDGIAEDVAAFGAAPAGTFPPRRGFGLLWRQQPSVRQRLGWALSEGEQPFQVQVQIGADGTIFIGGPDAAIFSLAPNLASWFRYP